MCSVCNRSSGTNVTSSSSSRMCVMNHNWLDRKQHLHLQSGARISRHLALSEDRICTDRIYETHRPSVCPLAGPRTQLAGHRSQAARTAMLSIAKGVTNVYSHEKLSHTEIYTSSSGQGGYAINHQCSRPGRHGSRGVCLPWLSYPLINRKHL